MEINEDEISATPKSEYKKLVKKLMNKAVFQYFLNINKSFSKINDATYTKFQIQPYLSTIEINNKEKDLLFNLQANCHSSKMSFKKMYKNYVKCIFKCPNNEDQIHTFTKCQPILTKVTNASSAIYKNIFSTVQEKKKTIQVFMKI